MTLKQYTGRRVRDVLNKLFSVVFINPYQFQLALNSELREIKREVLNSSPDNPALKGRKVYSQFDEDGIIEEIFRRIGGGRTFVEIGCGDGLENNTHYLLLKGWSGSWVDASLDNVRKINCNLPDGRSRLRVIHDFVDEISVRSLIHDNEAIDLLSIDIDGNDLNVLLGITAFSKPKVICVEYNAKFPPPHIVSIRYDQQHRWAQDDYHGASLQAFVNALPEFQLVCCGLSGMNAFFVRRDLAGNFTEYPTEVLFQPLRVPFIYFESGHPRSYKFLANELSKTVPSVGLPYEGQQISAPH